MSSSNRSALHNILLVVIREWSTQNWYNEFCKSTSQSLSAIRRHDTETCRFPEPYLLVMILCASCSYNSLLNCASTNVIMNTTTWSTSSICEPPWAILSLSVVMCHTKVYHISESPIICVSTEVCRVDMASKIRRPWEQMGSAELCERGKVKRLAQLTDFRNSNAWDIHCFWEPPANRSVLLASRQSNSLGLFGIRSVRVVRRPLEMDSWEHRHIVSLLFKGGCVASAAPAASSGSSSRFEVKYNAAPHRFVETVG